MEGYAAHVQMENRPGDMVQGVVLTYLPPLETSRLRTPKRIHIDESRIVLLEGALSNAILHINLNRYLSTILILIVMEINVAYLYRC